MAELVWVTDDKRVSSVQSPCVRHPPTSPSSLMAAGNIDQFAGLSYYKSLLQTPSPFYSRNLDVKNKTDNGISPGQQHGQHAPYGAGLHFSKQHGPSNQQHMQQSMATNANCYQKQQQQCNLHPSAAHEAQIQTSPLYQQGQQHSVSWQVDQMQPQQQLQYPAQAVIPLHNITNNHKTPTWATAATHDPFQLPHAQSAAGRTQPVQSQQLGTTPQGPTHHTADKHRFQRRQQVQQGATFDDVELDDSMLALVDGFSNQPQQLQHSIRHRQPQSRLQRSNAQHPQQQQTPGGKHGYQQRDGAPLSATAYASCHAPATTGLPQHDTSMQPRGQCVATSQQINPQYQPRPPVPAAQVHELHQQQQMQSLPASRQEHSFMQDRRTPPDSHALRQQQQHGKPCQQLSKPASSMTRGIAADGDSCRSSLYPQPSVVGDAGDDRHPMLLDGSTNRSPKQQQEQNPQQQAWQGFAQQQRQNRHQQRQQALHEQVRYRCAQLLHQLSLFVGDDSNEAAASAAAGPATGGNAAGKAGSSSNKRWPWLAADRRDAKGQPPGSPGYDPSTLYIPPAALSSMTEFNKQFWSIKSKCMDLVLFVRHGSFYNLFDIDADVGLRVGLNISGVMTANMWKVGCHKDYFAVWCAKVLAQGYSVGRVEEMPRSSAAGKLLVRQLVRIYTPGTAVEGLMADDLDHRAQTIMCITELPISNSHTTTSSSQRRTAHGQCEMNNSPDSSNSGSVIGVCVLDVSSGHCQAGVFSTADDPARSALAAALLMYDPIECIAVRSSLHSATVTLVVRHCEFKGAAQGLCVDGFGSSSSGCGGRHIPGLSWLPPAATAVVLQEPAQLLQQLLPEQSLQQLQEVAQAARSGSCNAADQGGRTRLAVLSAVAVAVMQLQRCSLSEDVLPTLELSALKGLGKSAAQNPGAPMLLDDKAIISLDILASSSSNNDGAAGISKKSAAVPPRAAPGSLLELLDHAASAAGKRTLQQWICRPLTQASAIDERLDVLDFFIAAPTAAATLQQRLADLPDADRLLPKAAAALRSLQLQQQELESTYQPQQQQPQQQQQQHSSSGFSVLGPMCADDPADSVARETKKAAWKALINIPACLMGLVEALALLRGAARQQLPSTTQLPLLHRALIAASKASRPAKALQGLLQGAQWTDTAASAAVPNGFNPAAGAGAGSIQLAPGADAAYDEAMQQLQQLQQEYQQELQHTLASYKGRSSKRVRDVLVGDEEQGVLCLVVQPPPGAVQAQRGFGRVNSAQQQSAASPWAAQLLLDESHQVVEQELLADSGVGAAVNRESSPGTAAGGRGRGARGRGRGRGRAAAAVLRDACDLCMVHVHIPLLQELFTEVQQATQQLEAAAAVALNRAASTLLDSYTVFKGLIKAVSELDVLAGFAEYIQRTSSPGCSLCRPRFAAAGAATAAAGVQAAVTSSPLLQLKGLWHPLLAASAAAGGGNAGGVVCNDVQLGGDKPGAMLLTGANMGGKSTLLRSACVAVILAQIGCYVPATSALLEPVDAIYTRIGAADAIMCGLSTFMVEMSETAACLAAATPASLIVLDELGRGTSTHDGYALAYAVLKHLAAPEPPSSRQPGQGIAAGHVAAVTPAAGLGSSTSGSRPRLLFATHYHNLTCEPDLVPHIQSCHMATEFNAAVGHLVHLYQLRQGAAPAGSCGIEVAALAGLPSSVLERATQVAAAVQMKYQIGA